MSYITRHVYKETSDIYELEIDDILVEDCKKHLSRILIDSEKNMPKITEELVEDLFNYKIMIPEVDNPMEFKNHNSTYESTIRDELLEFLDNYIYDFYVGEGDSEIQDVITEVR